MTFEEWYNQTYPEESFDSPAERNEHWAIARTGWYECERQLRSGKERYAIVRYETTDLQHAFSQCDNDEYILNLTTGEHWDFANDKWENVEHGIA